jgi:hypothetical protein
MIIESAPTARYAGRERKNFLANGVSQVTPC